MQPIERLRKPLDLLKSLSGRLLKASTWEAFEEALFDLSENVNWGVRDEDRALYRKNPSMPGLAEGIARDRDAVSRLREVMDSLLAALKGSIDAPKASLGMFRILLEPALSQTLGEERGPQEGIQLLTFQGLHGAFFDELFLMGLNDRVFPQAKAEASWFPESFIVDLSGILKRRLWSSAGEWYQAGEEILAKALSQAKKVTLSWRARTDDEKEMLPAPIVDSIASLFPEGAVKRYRAEWPVPPREGDVADLGELWLLLARNSCSESPPREFRRHFWGRSDRLWARMCRNRRMSAAVKSDGHDDILSEAHFQAWLSTRPTFKGPGDGREWPVLSAGVMRNYAECPRKFWYSDVLRLSPWERASEGFSSQEQGSLVHRTLELFFRPLLLKTAKSGDLALDRLLGIFDQESRMHSLSPNRGRLPLFDLEIRKIRGQLSSWHARQGELHKADVVGLEWPFDASSENPPYFVEDGGQSFFLQGRVDRIDRLQDGSFEVRDYKLAFSSFYSAAKEGDPAWLPLSLYALKIQEAFQTKGGDPPKVSAKLEFIVPMGKGPFKGAKVSGPDAFRDIYSRMLTRSIMRDPSRKACEWCPFTTVCGGGFEE
jgi:hypothetical protein